MSEEFPPGASGDLPRWAVQLLQRLAPLPNRDIVLGDFAEVYRHIVAREGRGRAQRWYWGQVLKSTPAFLGNGIYFGVVCLCAGIVKEPRRGALLVARPTTLIESSVGATCRKIDRSYGAREEGVLYYKQVASTRLVNLNTQTLKHHNTQTPHHDAARKVPDGYALWGKENRWGVIAF